MKVQKLTFKKKKQDISKNIIDINNQKKSLALFKNTQNTKEE